MARQDWPIVGNAPAIDFFESLLTFERRSPGSIGGTYLVVGPNKVGRTEAVDYFIRRLLGSNQAQPGTIDMWPDIFRLRRETDKREIGVEQAREFSARLSLSSFNESYRIGIIHEADSLSHEAGNALLKSLEEARDQAIIFLIARSVDQLPATIVSRSQKIIFRPVATNEIYEWLVAQQGLDRPFAQNIARLANGRPGLALELSRDKEMLEAKLLPARVLVEAFRKRLYERWRGASSLLAGHKGAAAASAALEVVDSWRSVIRDILLTLLNQPELTQHAFLAEEIRVAAGRIDVSEARRLDERLQQANTYISANVNPLIALENFLITI